MEPRPSKIPRYLLGSLLLGSIIAGCVTLIHHWDYVQRLEHYGYLGLFLVGIATGSPTPIAAAYLVLIVSYGAILNPILVGLVSGSGLTLGATILYSAGRSGRRLLPELDIPDIASKKHSTTIARFWHRIQSTKVMIFFRRNQSRAIFLFSSLPNPFFAPMAVTLGTSRYKLSRFLLYCWAGQTTKGIALAFVGYFALRLFLEFLGVFHLPN